MLAGRHSEPWCTEKAEGKYSPGSHVTLRLSNTFTELFLKQISPEWHIDKSCSEL